MLTLPLVVEVFRIYQTQNSSADVFDESSAAIRTVACSWAYCQWTPTKLAGEPENPDSRLEVRISPLQPDEDELNKRHAHTVPHEYAWKLFQRVAAGGQAGQASGARE